ncbi:hypothetical protein [Sphingomonas sp. Leaf21]|uniref:hypothetical protein n=1 Tax=Sphingomonas sp. Leaf21 TaxID=2876550 RepID=UPI001E3E1296|nr:hypothetical protein [Sphingomonas sp. Leaf21]
MTGSFLLAMAYDVTLVAVCTYAFARGGRPERWGACINLAGALLSSAARSSGIATWAPMDGVILAIDAGVAFAFYRLATTTTRFWPIWALGFALGDIFASVIGRFLPGSMAIGYVNGLGIYAYLALFVLALGCVRLPADADEITRSGVRPSCHSRTNSASASDSNCHDPSSKP